MRFFSIFAAGLASSVLAAPTVSVEKNDVELDVSPRADVFRRFVPDMTPVTKVKDAIAHVELVVADKVDVITEILAPIGDDKTKQLSIVSVVVADLGDITVDLKVAVDEILAIALPAVLELVDDVLELVGDILGTVLSLVTNIVGNLANLIEGLLDPIKALVFSELKDTLALLGPLVLPILVFIKQIAGDLPEVGHNVTQILEFVNSGVSAFGLPVINLD